MKKIHTWILVGSAMALALWLSGCSTSGLQAGDSAYTNSSYLVVEDPLFADQISIVRVDHDMVGDIMRAHVSLKSNRNRSLQIRYRFTWYDGQGMEVDPSGKPYRDLIIEGKDTVAVTSMAPSPQAREFKIRVHKVKAIKIENIR